MATYYAEAEALHRAYTEAIGWCLQYKIKVYGPGGRERALGDLRDDIAKYRLTHRLDPFTGAPPKEGDWWIPAEGPTLFYDGAEWVPWRRYMERRYS